MKQLTLLFLRKDDMILLAMKKRGFGVGRWNGVGGKVEASETIEQALLRETQEEIEVTPIEYKQVAQIVFNELHEEERKQMHVSVYVCTNWEGEPTETEEMRPQWFNVTKIPYQQMWADDIFWLPLVLEDRKLQANFTLDEDDNVVKHSINIVESLEVN